MHIIPHAIGGQGAVQPLSQFRLTQAQVEIKCLGPFPQPFQVLVQKRNNAFVNPQPLPDTVAENKATVEHRHHGLIPGKQLAVDVDLDIGIAAIDGVGVGAAHGYSRGSGHWSSTLPQTRPPTGARGVFLGITPGQRRQLLATP